MTTKNDKRVLINDLASQISNPYLKEYWQNYAWQLPSPHVEYAKLCIGMILSTEKN